MLLTMLPLTMIGSFSAQAAGPPSDSTKRESEIESRAAKIKTWQELHSLRQQYATFDDGAVGEEYSEFVVHTLATHWNTLPELTAIVSADPAFGKFILRHIDATTDTGDMKAVLRQAASGRPAQVGSAKEAVLRRAIAAAARAALAQMRTCAIL